jgi:hypothetical protein
MATTFKQFSNEDVTSTRTLLHESIPMTGSILSGTYNEGGTASEKNVKNFSHGLFQSLYDFPFLSSSANHILDLTAGYASGSAMSASSNTQNSDKINVYNEMAQILAGHDQIGNIRQFDEDGNFAAGGAKLKECYFVNFSRLLNKDEIKKGTFSLKLGAGPAFAFNGAAGGGTFAKLVTIADTSGSNGYFVNSPAGEYGVLFATGSNHTQGQVTYVGSNTDGGIPCGLIFYQAGIAVLSGSIFNKSGSASPSHAGGILLSSSFGTGDLAQVGVSLGNPLSVTSGQTGFSFVTGSSISGSCDALRNRIYNISYSNTTELNSTIYFCRASHNEFNYSSNPSYLNPATSQIRVKQSTFDQPVSYITTIGLYGANNELLAVAKVSEPVKKTPDTELALRVRLDY